MAWDIGAIEMGASTAPPSDDGGGGGTGGDGGHPTGGGGGGGGGGTGGGGGGGGFGGGGGGRIGPDPIETLGHKPLLLAKLSLDQGTEYESDLGVRHPSWYYQGRVIRWGTLTRELSGPPPTLPIIGAGELEIEDTHSYWRDRLADITQRRRPVEIRITEEGGSVQDAPIVYTGELDKASFPPGLFKPKIKDIWQRWMKRQIPPWIDRLNYPNQPDGQDSGFFPIVFGRVTDQSPTPQGAIPLLLVDTLTNDYAVNRTVTKEIIAVYRKLPGDDVFSVVSASEYSKVMVPKTIGGYDYDFITYCRFNSAQPDGTLIRADIDGVSARGNFFSMPPISNATIRNPVDHIINIMYYLFVLEPTALEFDEWAFFNTWTKHEALRIYIDGACAEPMTFGELIGQICYSSLTDIFQTKFGKIAVEFTTVEDPNRPVFDDTFDILRAGSFDGDEGELLITIADIERTVNQFEYHFARNYATNEWGDADFYNNATDQAELGEIEHDIFEFMFIRDPAVAAYMIRLLSFHYSLRTKIVTFFLSAPRAIPQLDLAKLIGLTYYAGYGGPWVNQELKVYRLSHQLERHELEVTALTHHFTPIIFGEAILSGGAGGGSGSLVAGLCPDQEGDERQYLLRVI